jgi:Gas vesicle synthesis protein GvpL/GvpF
VLPLRLAVVFRTREQVVARFDPMQSALKTALTRLDGCAQWTLKVAAAPTDRRVAEATSGTDYLRRAREGRQKRAMLLSEARATAVRLHDKLVAAAVDAGEGTAGGEVLFAAHYLVRHADKGRFLDLIDEATAAEGAARLRAEVKGPWAPYAFVPRMEEAS